jgi:ribonuclease P/MRP protein subunit POP5
MTKARALKKRYILFEFRGKETDEEALKRSLYAEALRFFGEFGLSYAAVKLVGYDKKSKKGILRCERDYLERVLGFLALLSSLDGVEARFVALKSSGTLKSLELDSTQSR